jgi:phosphoenolpyruvate synthase/pyruvate phosphate dikinase
MIGVRGCFRYIRHPELLVLGLQMLARILEEAPNPHIMIPLVDAVKLEASREAVTMALGGW